MHDDMGIGADPRQALGRLLAFAAKAARGYLEQRLATAGSSFAVWTALFALQERGPLIQRELAEMLNVEGPTLTRHLARMEAEGLIERRRTSTDRRAAVVHLTDAGRAMHARLSDVVRASGGVVFDGFTDQEVEAFSGYLERLIKNVAGVPRRGARRPGEAGPECAPAGPS